MIDGKITRYDCSWFYLGKSHFAPDVKPCWRERRERSLLIPNLKKQRIMISLVQTHTYVEMLSS